jgi:glycosyltransferase involved in cell wall biosynthesis
LDLAAPYKIFESVAYNLPIVTFEGTEAARLIEAEGFGWVVKDSAELVSLIAQLRATPAMLHEKRLELRDLAKKHSWVNRALSVAEALRA